jgi:hypothetical protein
MESIDLSPLLSICCTCFSFAGIGLAIFAYLRYAQAKRMAWERGWRELATRTGLKFETNVSLTDPAVNSASGPIKISFGSQTPHTTRVTGQYKNRSLTLDTFTQSQTSGETNLPVTSTRLTLEISQPPNRSFSLAEKGLLPGGNSIPLNDQPFEEHFVVVSQPEEFARQVLASADLRQRLLALRPRVRVSVEGEELRLEQDQLHTDADFLVSFIELGNDLAAAVEQASAA